MTNSPLGKVHSVNANVDSKAYVEVIYSTESQVHISTIGREKGSIPRESMRDKYLFEKPRKNKVNLWGAFLIWANFRILLKQVEYEALLACAVRVQDLTNKVFKLNRELERYRHLDKKFSDLEIDAEKCMQEKDKLQQKSDFYKSQVRDQKNILYKKMSLENEVEKLNSDIKELHDSKSNLEEELKNKELKYAIEMEELKKMMTDDFEKRLELEKQKVKVEVTNQFIANKILHDEQVDNHNNYDRKFYDELASRLQSVERQRDELLRQTELLKIQQIANESKEAAEQSKLQREWQKAEQSQSNAEMLKMKLEMEAKLKEEDLQRERQNLKIENTATQFDLQRQQLQVNFAAMKNELTEMGLSFKDFVLQKTNEFRTYELGIKEHLLKMGEMINYVNAKNLESEKIKMEVMERISQMGLELKQHETFLEGNLLSADRLKLETDRQNMVNEKQANEIALEMQRFNVDYGSKRNQLEQLMLKVSEAQFHNHAKASMLEMDNKVLEIQTELKGMAFERIGMDMMFKEGSMKLSEQENKIAMIKVQIEQKAKELQSLQKIGMLTNHIESERLKSMQRELALKGQITHMQNQLDREYMRADYMRQTISFLNG